MPLQTVHSTSMSILKTVHLAFSYSPPLGYVNVTTDYGSRLTTVTLTNKHYCELVMELATSGLVSHRIIMELPTMD